MSGAIKRGGVTPPAADPARDVRAHYRGVLCELMEVILDADSPPDDGAWDSVRRLAEFGRQRIAAVKIPPGPRP